MADFHQTGVITTFHRFGATDVARMEKDLAKFNKKRPIALVLPTTPAELGSPALTVIIHNLREVPYLNEIVITLGRTADAEHFRQARELFAALPQRHRLIWASGPGL